MMHYTEMHQCIPLRPRDVPRCRPGTAPGPSATGVPQRASRHSMASAGGSGAPSAVGGDVDRALRENDALIAAILAQQNAGRMSSATDLLERLQANLAYVSALAEGQPNAAASACAPSAAANRMAYGPQRSAVALVPAGPVPPPPEAPGYGARWSDEERARLYEAWPRLARAGRDGRPNYRGLSEAVGSKTPAQVRAHIHKKRAKAKATGNGGAVEAAGENAPPSAGGGN